MSPKHFFVESFHEIYTLDNPAKNHYIISLVCVLEMCCSLAPFFPYMVNYLHQFEIGCETFIFHSRGICSWYIPLVAMDILSWHLECGVFMTQLL